MQEYKNDKLVVRYDPAICIHTGECVQSIEEAVDEKIALAEAEKATDAAHKHAQAEAEEREARGL